MRIPKALAGTFIAVSIAGISGRAKAEEPMTCGPVYDERLLMCMPDPACTPPPPPPPPRKKAPRPASFRNA